MRSRTARESSAKFSRVFMMGKDAAEGIRLQREGVGLSVVQQGMSYLKRKNTLNALFKFAKISIFIFNVDTFLTSLNT